METTNIQGTDEGILTIVLPGRGGAWPVGDNPNTFPSLLKFRQIEHLGDPQRKTHIVYFIYCAGFVKIGITTSIKKRMATLQIGAPWQTRLVGIMAGGRTTEAFLHTVFREHSVGGEWFALGPELREALSIIAVPELAGHLEEEEAEYKEWIHSEAKRLGL